MTYFLSNDAKEDLWRIYTYGINRFGELQAEKYFFMMHDCFDKIVANPLLFPLAEKFQNVERYCVCGVDTIYYNVKKNRIEIVTIIGRQNF